MIFYIILLYRGNSFSVAVLCWIFWQKESLNISSKTVFSVGVRTCPGCSHANLCPVVTFLLGCSPQCAAAAPACTSLTPARGFQTGPRQFHTALRRKPCSSGWIWGWRTNRASKIKVGLLTVNVVLQCADALLVQTHHRREEDGLGARVYLHLPVKSLPSEDGRFLTGVTGIGLFCNFGGKMSRNKRAHFWIQLKLFEAWYLFSQSETRLLGFHTQADHQGNTDSSIPWQTP